MRPEFTILTVCTGNICRSPLAAQLLAHLLRDIPEVSVASAGTHALADRPMSEFSQEIAIARGVEHPEHHRARQMTAALLESSDLILAMASDHRRSIIEVSPRVTRRVFALREFARLADATTDEELALEIGEASSEPAHVLRAAVRAVTLSRSLLEPLQDPAEADVIDPYGHDRDTYDVSARQLIPAVEATASVLRRALRVAS